MQQQKTELALLADDVRARGPAEGTTGIGRPDEINDLIDIERVRSGEIRLHRHTVDMADAVRTAVATFTCDTQSTRSIEVATEPAWVDVDPTRLAEMMTNIFANAVQYTQPGGHIRVSLHADGNDAVVTIEDKSLGISAGLLPFIFDPSVQADRTPARTQTGLGIGLTLVRQLAELHGGTVAAASAGEGHGSMFTVRLPQVSPLRRFTAEPDPQQPRQIPLIDTAPTLYRDPL